MRGYGDASQDSNDTWSITIPYDGTWVVELFDTTSLCTTVCTTPMQTLATITTSVVSTATDCQKATLAAKKDDVITVRISRFSTAESPYAFAVREIHDVFTCISGAVTGINEGSSLDNNKNDGIEMDSPIRIDGTVYGVTDIDIYNLDVGPGTWSLRLFEPTDGTGTCKDSCLNYNSIAVEVYRAGNGELLTSTYSCHIGTFSILDTSSIVLKVYGLAARAIVPYSVQISQGKPLGANYFSCSSQPTLPPSAVPGSGDTVEKCIESCGTQNKQYAWVAPTSCMCTDVPPSGNKRVHHHPPSQNLYGGTGQASIRHSNDARGGSGVGPGHTRREAESRSQEKEKRQPTMGGPFTSTTGGGMLPVTTIGLTTLFSTTSGSYSSTTSGGGYGTTADDGGGSSNGFSDPSDLSCDVLCKGDTSETCGGSSFFFCMGTQ